MALPTDPKARKGVPLYSGLLKYFPRALAAIAHLSQVGNDQHNPGEPLHWAKGKSQDELDACLRHLLEAGKVDTDNIRHSTKGAWRAVANLEKELEAEELGITVEELNARYKAEEVAKAAKAASRAKAKARKARARAKARAAEKATPVPALAIRAKTDAEYAAEPCIELEYNKKYRVVAVAPCGNRNVIWREVFATQDEAGGGITSDGYRWFLGTFCRVAPVEP
jgi:hypothetical protein